MVLQEVCLGVLNDFSWSLEKMVSLADIIPQQAQFGCLQGVEASWPGRSLPSASLSVVFFCGRVVWGSLARTSLSETFFLLLYAISGSSVS